MREYFSMHHDSLFILKMWFDRCLCEKFDSSITKREHVALETAVLENLCNPTVHLTSQESHGEDKLGLILTF